jgi:hypothetical protein
MRLEHVHDLAIEPHQRRAADAALQPRAVAAVVHGRTDGAAELTQQLFNEVSASRLRSHAELARFPDQAHRGPGTFDTDDRVPHHPRCYSS